MIPARQIVTRVSHSQGFYSSDYNMNIYRGCCHGCIYCDSRSSCYRIENFDLVRAKENALGIIERELASKKKPGLICTGSMSDPYNPFETQMELTRGALKLVEKYGFGISIFTKGTLVTRDIDLLTRIAAQATVSIRITITTADDSLCSRIEPHSPPSSQRFEAINELSGAGLFAGLTAAPLLPFINDSVENVEALAALAIRHKAQFFHMMPGVTLRDEQREYFYKMLDRHFPGLRGRYQETFGQRYYCSSPNSRKLYSALKKALAGSGIPTGDDAILAAQRDRNPPAQLSLF
ncbi:radical SAM protein [Oscillospiraceae bacterium MB08-C2-2]|nr:radical SAM protein [Oscillospiraceae bacterium MB08-C2-2]